FNHFRYRSIGGREDFAAKCIIIFVFASFASVGLSVRTDAEQIKGKPLVRHVMMVVYFSSITAPKNQPSITKRQRQFASVLFGHRFRGDMRLKVQPGDFALLI